MERKEWDRDVEKQRWKTEGLASVRSSQLPILWFQLFPKPACLPGCGLHEISVCPGYKFPFWLLLVQPGFFICNSKRLNYFREQQKAVRNREDVMAHPAPPLKVSPQGIRIFLSLVIQVETEWPYVTGRHRQEFGLGLQQDLALTLGPEAFQLWELGWCSQALPSLCLPSNVGQRHTSCNCREDEMISRISFLLLL